ncbi:MAG: hypothetical protein A2Y15_06155 [Clostridiales bacterium GWF2_36_10]|nr:MAG: hypothetical protein A2Y15_06155 [Clostridiales bacterium GWF2_36_10]HAN21901.1 hypothetical protein [Clostridiales bacterium]
MKDRTKKTLKWTLISICSLLILIVLTILILLVLAYNKIYEQIPYVERESSYVMESKPEGIEYVSDESYTEDETSINETISEAEKTPIYIKEPIDKNIINVLLVGRDVTQSSGSSGRSDSMMLLSYNKTTGEVTINSFLRDCYVPIEGHSWNRLNATYSIGGVGMTINTINEIFDLDIQHYISIDFNGFIGLIDKIDGVTISITGVEAEYMNEHYSCGFTAGEVTLDGDTALKFARIRKIAVSGGDFNRTERQRRILVSAINKMLNLNDIGKTISLINNGLEYVKTNLSSGNIISLTSDFVSKKNSDIKTGAIPAEGTWSYAMINRMSIIDLNFDENKNILHKRIYGDN